MSLRIGVLLCKCGGHISNTINVDEVAEYAKTLPNVVYVANEEHLCDEETVKRLTEEVARNNLDRIAVAACTPTILDPRFMLICQRGGINPRIVEWVNIREQCAWVHADEPAKATEKAKDLVRMVVARAALAEPTAASIPQVDEEKCIKCGLCEAICPFGAIKLGKAEEEYAIKVDELLCKACGICAASCPGRAITLPVMTNEQIIAQIKTVLEA